jgi:ribosomal protein S18 acetylase RimI-like enzyme
MDIRLIEESDYESVISVINKWWSGRDMASLLPKLFFIHFKNTSFIIENDGEMIGFLIGFKSQTYPNEAYIHFVGVHPDYRKTGMAKRLYETFFDTVQQMGCNIVRCITSPVNKNSIAFHIKMGFEIENGDFEVDGISVFSNYAGEGNHRVLFIRKL